jgi:predicted nucleic acid-binding protein
MLVVADSSPLHYLILIDHVNLLRSVYGTVTIPTSVANELKHINAPRVVREFVGKPPEWLLIQSPHDLLAIDEIDEGERAAISLAVELRADLLLIDDLDGRRAALQHGLKITGIVGILMDASERGFIELKPLVSKLVDAGLYISKELIDRLLSEG